MSKDVDRVTHEIVCLCDYCANEQSVPFDDYPDFSEAQREIEGMGWLSRKIDGEWYDFCCQECYQAWKRGKP